MPTDAAIVVGHHPDDPGAALRLGSSKIHEYHLWRPFAAELAVSLRAAGVSAEVVERPQPNPNAALAERVNETGADAAIELHHNAHHSGAEGTEMLHYERSKAARRLASLLQGNTVRALDTKDRGVKAKTGFPFLSLTKMPAVICEPAFGSNEQDAWRLLTGQADLLSAYRSAIVRFVEGEAVA